MILTKIIIFFVRPNYYYIFRNPENANIKQFLIKTALYFR